MEAATTGDEAGEKVLRACYDPWVLNEFVCKSPVGLADESASFDFQTTQNFKCPRDVIRDKAGTGKLPPRLLDRKKPELLAAAPVRLIPHRGVGYTRTCA